MFVIGLTGGIGTGKTQVSEILSELGATIINADLVGHEAYLPNTQTFNDVVDAFGSDIVSESGEIDRRKLGPIVFADPKSMDRLNAIMHPRIFDMIKERIGVMAGEGIDRIVVEAAILIEAGWTPLADEIWVTTSPEDAVIARLRERNNMDEETARSRIASQMSQEERASHADAVIVNDQGLDELRKHVEDTWRQRAPSQT